MNANWRVIRHKLGVLETFVSNKLNDSIVRLPENHQILQQEIQTLREDMKRGFDEILSQSKGPDETTKLRINQLEYETHFRNEQQRIAQETNEHQRIAQESHLISENRYKELKERIEALETAAESHRQRLVGLETTPKQEVKTPDTGISRKLFEAPDSSGSHCPNEGRSMPKCQTQEWQRD